MVVVTNAKVIQYMTENLITYLSTNVTDPIAGTRSTLSDIDNDNKWVKIKHSGGKNVAPNIYVGQPRSAGEESSGNRNIIRSLRFQIMIHGVDYDQTVQLADETFNELYKHTSNLFSSNKMWRPANWITTPELEPNPEKLGEWYANMSVTFEYYHVAT